MSVSGNQVGGLGNQLFITAATIAYGLRFGLQPIIQDYWFYPTSSACVGREQSIIIREACQQYIGQPPTDIIQYNEPHWHYRTIPKLDGNVQLNGYFQSEQYFEDCKEVIKQLFYPVSFTHPLLNISYRKVAVHIRRADYLKLAHVHHLLPLSYYQHAIHYLNQPNTLFLFFSDDKEFIRKTFKGICVDDSDENEFKLMAHCDDFIIANSTFSWWAAYLSKTVDKTVICPKNWFSYCGPPNWQSIYCPGWIIMDDDGSVKN